MGRIASPSRRAIDTVLIFLQAAAAGASGIEFVTTTSSSGESMMRCTAGPLKTPCVAHATPRRAPHDAARAAIHPRTRGVKKRARRVDHVVDDDAVAALNVADDVHHFAD